MPEGGLVQGTCGLVAGWAGQSGVLVPSGVVIAVAAPGFLGHLASISDLGINVVLDQFDHILLCTCTFLHCLRSPWENYFFYSQPHCVLPTPSYPIVSVSNFADLLFIRFTLC